MYICHLEDPSSEGENNPCLVSGEVYPRFFTPPDGGVRNDRGSIRYDIIFKPLPIGFSPSYPVVLTLPKALKQ